MNNQYYNTFDEKRIDTVGQNGNEGKHYDQVTNPKHYQLIPDKDVQVIDVIKAALSQEEYAGYCKGNIIKYALRAGEKFNEPANKDLGKARQYIDFIVEDSK